jgi:integrase
MTRKDGLPRRVYLKHGRYWHVGLDGKWRGLTRESAGLPAMLRALATLHEGEIRGHLMPAVITRWQQSKEMAGEWEASMRRNMERVAKQVAGRFADISPRDVTAPLVFEYLQPYLAKPRTYNLHRSVIRQALSFAALEGLRDGHNPADDVPQRKVKKRMRIVTDAEIAAIKAALLAAKRGGSTHCLMVDLCMLTGQRISDVLKMRWQDVTDEGLLVDQGKSDAKLLIEMTPALKAAIDACAEGRDRIGFLLVQSTGKPYRYAGVRSAWVRAMTRAGIEDLHIHDMRGRAGADVADASDSYQAQKLLGHKSVTMTEGYISGKTRRRAKPSK